MPDRRHRPLGRGARRIAAAALAATLAVGAARAQPPQVEYVATYVWQMDDDEFGGFSGIEISADGDRFTVLSDRASLRWGSVERDAQGRIRKLEIAGRARLRDADGAPLKPGWQGDSEGLALAADGTIWVSFEGLTRVARYDTPDSPSQPLPRPPEFRTMQRNASLEALAILPDGTLLTIPERSGALTRPFPVWRWQNGRWDQPFSIPRSGDWLVVGADVGPDGRLYILERDFKGLLGFRSRVRRMELTADGPVNDQVVLETRPLQYDNLEGISVWHDGQGIRITMISDDNFGLLQRTELVEYRLVEAPMPNG